MLIEFHIIQNHAPSNLNRDDTGSPKECTFGGVRRARISSQCLKRSVRRSDLFAEGLKGQLATRTRKLPQLVADALRKEGLADDLARVVEKKTSGFGNREGKEQEPSKTTGRYETAQTMFLTEGDVAAVIAVMRGAAEGARTAAALDKVAAKELQARAVQSGFRPITVDVALFGRMTTSEAFRDVEASAQVAHAISTHKVDHEFDYFTAVDDLQGQDEAEREEDAGADMIGDVEFNSACYYKYFNVDVAGLVDNLTGARGFRRDVSADDRANAVDLAAAAIGCLLEAAARVTPTGKQNTFAAHQLPALILVEARPRRTPVSYANAFVEPARPGREGDLVAVSLRKLAAHAQAVHQGFNLESSPRLLLAPEAGDLTIDGVERVGDLRTLRQRVEEVARRV
jgi:CRISPR system Cascade subunit CasC